MKELLIQKQWLMNITLLTGLALCRNALDSIIRSEDTDTLWKFTLLVAVDRHLLDAKFNLHQTVILAPSAKVIRELKALL